MVATLPGLSVLKPDHQQALLHLVELVPDLYRIRNMDTDLVRHAHLGHYIWNISDLTFHQLLDLYKALGSILLESFLMLSKYQSAKFITLKRNKETTIP